MRKQLILRENTISDQELAKRETEKEKLSIKANLVKANELYEDAKTKLDTM